MANVGGRINPVYCSVAINHQQTVPSRVGTVNAIRQLKTEQQTDPIPNWPVHIQVVGPENEAQGAGLNAARALSSANATPVKRSETEETGIRGVSCSQDDEMMELITFKGEGGSTIIITRFLLQGSNYFKTLQSSGFRDSNSNELDLSKDPSFSGETINFYRAVLFINHKNKGTSESRLENLEKKAEGKNAEDLIDLIRLAEYLDDGPVQETLETFPAVVDAQAKFLEQRLEEMNKDVFDKMKGQIIKTDIGIDEVVAYFEEKGNEEFRDTCVRYLVFKLRLGTDQDKISLATFLEQLPHYTLNDNLKKEIYSEIVTTGISPLVAWLRGLKGNLSASNDSLELAGSAVHLLKPVFIEDYPDKEENQNAIVETDIISLLTELLIDDHSDDTTNENADDTECFESEIVFFLYCLLEIGNKINEQTCNAMQKAIEDHVPLSSNQGENMATEERSTAIKGLKSCLYNKINDRGLGLELYGSFDWLIETT